MPSPQEYGCKKSDDKSEATWKPIGTLLPEVAKASRNLVKCGCKALPQCSRKCRCREAGLSCMALCQCGGHCEQ